MLFSIIALLGWLFLIAVPIMYLWDYAVVPVFNVNKINYLQCVSILFIIQAALNPLKISFNKE